MTDRDGPGGLLDEVGAFLLGERLWDAWHELDTATEDLHQVLGIALGPLEADHFDGRRVPTRQEYDRLGERLEVARAGFDREVAETVLLVDEHAAWGKLEQGTGT